MSEREQLEQLVGKALLDTSFRERLLRDPESTAESIGLRLSGPQTQRIGEWDGDLLDTVAGPIRDWLEWFIQWLLDQVPTRGW